MRPARFESRIMLACWRNAVRIGGMRPKSGGRAGAPPRFIVLVSRSVPMPRRTALFAAALLAVVSASAASHGRPGGEDQPPPLPRRPAGAKAAVPPTAVALKRRSERTDE